MNALNFASAREMLLRVADAIVENKPLLTELDSAIGDGDHGITMALGVQKGRDKTAAMPEGDNVFSLFVAFGNAMLMSMGGASGVIFGSMFAAGAKNAEPKNALSPAEFAAMFRRSLSAVQERGKAQVGDKTMVDALAPAVDAMEATASGDYHAMFVAASEAARSGAESTKALEAKFGRAKSLMARAIGHPDPGATSVWIILCAMRDYCA